MKTFSEFQQTDEWGLYVTVWRNRILLSLEARSKGFDSEKVAEGAIAAFINACIEEKAKRFAYAVDAPHLVTCNGKDWYDLQLPAWRRGN